MRGRNYKREYKRRLALGRARGLTRSQARGHAKARTNPAKAPRTIVDRRIRGAILEMNRGRSLSAAARREHVSPRRLLKILRERRLVQRKGRRWIIKDKRPRRAPVMTGGRSRVLILRDYTQAQLVGEHHVAVGEFVATNKFELLDRFKGQTVETVSGRKYPLETDPNALHRIAAMESPPFHEIYHIYD